MFETGDIIAEEAQIVDQFETEKEEGKPKLNSKEDSDIYVISVDNTPMYYVRDFEVAKKHMWNFAQILRSECSEFKTCVGETDGCPEKLTIVGQNKFSIINYDRVLYRLCISTLSELVETRN